jgi:F-type H+-transporting ATPase subunit epsilon
MAGTFKLSVVAPDRLVFEEEIRSLVVPAHEGYLGVWAGHRPTLAALKPGVLEFVTANNQQQYVAIAGGFADIEPDGVIVLADDASHSDEIDIKAAEEDLEEARKALRGETSKFTTEEATKQIERATARIRAARSAR